MKGFTMARHTPGKKQLKMTEERKEAFLEALRRGGHPVSAARAASPGAAGSCYSSFVAVRKRDVEFRIAWDDALAEFNSSIFDAVVERAMVDKSDRILELLTKARLEEFKKQHLQIDGAVEHTVTHLSPEEQRKVDAILRSAPESDPEDESAQSE